MDYLSVKEVAELKGCSVRYIQKRVSEQKLEAVIEYNNNCMQYMIPVSALPEELQQRYYGGISVSTAPADKCLPAAPTKETRQREKRDIGSFSAAEREVISWWCELLRDWRIKRKGYESLAEGDMVFVAETKRICRDFMAAHGIEISRDILYRK